MRFSTYFKEHLLAYDLTTKESYKIMEAEKIKENVYLLNVFDKQRKLTTLTLTEGNVKNFKFIRKRNIGRTIIEFEEILSLLNETNTVAGTFGANSTGVADQFSSDWYAKGDARNVWGAIPAKIQRRNLKGIESFMKTRKLKNSKKKRSKSKKKSD